MNKLGLQEDVQESWSKKKKKKKKKGSTSLPLRSIDPIESYRSILQEKLSPNSYIYIIDLSHKKKFHCFKCAQSWFRDHLLSRLISSKCVTAASSGAPWWTILCTSSQKGLRRQKKTLSVGFVRQLEPNCSSSVLTDGPPPKPSANSFHKS